MNRKRVAVLVLVATALLLAACGQAATPEPTATLIPVLVVTPTREGRPVITIEALPGGEQAYLGQEFLIQSRAIDTVGVTRIDLYVDDVLRRTDTSPEPEGRTDFALLQPWIPIALGERTISVVAYRADGTASEPVTRVFNVVEGPPPASPTPSMCTARANLALNVRNGPSRDYAILDVLDLGEMVEIQGRDESTSWWKIDRGWISGAYTTIFGDCADVPLASYGPPPPTGAPTLPPAAAPTSTPAPGPQPADLVVTGIDMPTRFDIKAGGRTSVVIRVTIANIGEQPAGAFRTKVYPTGRGGPRGSFDLPVVGSLQPGESITLSATVNYNVAGSFTVEAVVDPNNQVAERNEGNNSAFLNVRVRSVSPAPGKKPTATPQPTATPEPTETPVPTETPTPTEEPEDSELDTES